jgi:leader peptidase (prepilin peptidase) / N-methyltransferase
MNLVFAVAAVVVAAASGWPASALIATFSGATATARAGSLPSPRASADAASVGRAAHADLGTGLTALVTAALVLGVTVRVHQLLVASAVGWLVICGVPLAVIDSRVRRLPDVLTGACFAVVGALLIAAAATAGQWHDLARAASGAAIVAAAFALLALARPGSAGLGDAKLGLSTGAVAAWAGWGVLLISVFAAFVLAAGYGVALLVSGRASLRSSVPFGPFLLAGCVATVLLADGSPPHI